MVKSSSGSSSSSSSSSGSSSSSSSSGRVHVISRSSGWAVKKEGASRVTKVYGSKDSAVREATKNISKGKAIVVHKQDGSIQQWIKK